MLSVTDAKYQIMCSRLCEMSDSSLQLVEIHKKSMVSYWRKRGSRLKPVGKVNHQAICTSSSISESSNPNMYAESPLVIQEVIQWYNLSIILNLIERKGQTKTNKMSNLPTMFELSRGKSHHHHNTGNPQ